MKLLFTIILALQIATGFSQIDFEPDSNKVKLFPEVAQKINILNKDFDFQLRFWAYGGLIAPPHRRLFVMTSKNKRWNCISYVFVSHKREKYKIEKHKIVVKNYDSIWNYLIANDVLNLPDMELLKKDFYIIIKPKIKELVLTNNETKEFSTISNSIEEIKIIASGVRKKQILIADGTMYSIELFKNNKYKRIDYHCPVTYGNEYKHIDELQKMSNIVQYIFKIIGTNDNPC